MTIVILFNDYSVIFSIIVDWLFNYSMVVLFIIVYYCYSQLLLTDLFIVLFSVIDCDIVIPIIPIDYSNDYSMIDIIQWLRLFHSIYSVFHWWFIQLFPFDCVLFSVWDNVIQWLLFNYSVFNSIIQWYSLFQYDIQWLIQPSMTINDQLLFNIQWQWLIVNIQWLCETNGQWQMTIPLFNYSNYSMTQLFNSIVHQMIQMIFNDDIQWPMTQFNY